MEKDKIIMEEQKRKREENRDDVLRQIKIKEEKAKLESREVLEEGRKVRQKNDDYRERMERIKQQKIKELKDLGIENKYISDLERYKIV